MADIFTKPLAEKTTWQHALWLISQDLCPDVTRNGGKDSESLDPQRLTRNPNLLLLERALSQFNTKGAGAQIVYTSL